jgi:hypothetical protein
VQDLVAGLTPRAVLPLALAICLLFSTLGVLSDLFSGADQPASIVVANVAFSGIIALAYAYSGLRRRLIVFIGAALVHFFYVKMVGLLISRTAALPAAQVPLRLTHDAAWITAALTASYASFLWFINGTAARYLRVRAEMDLAHGIHTVLVPPVTSMHGDYEFVGMSIASGEVGGDLVDVVSTDEGWFGYVADVSGHGVSSGVVMGMFKSALRMRLRQPGPIAALLDDLNTVLYPLKSQAMFITAACVRGGRGGAIEYALAGHLPILHVSGGTVREITTPQVAVGMFEDSRFVSASVECAPGDLLALITDGLTEVFDKADQELGIGAIQALLASTADQPLNTIADAIIAKARAHGSQLDDQTLLLIRRQKVEGRK